MKVLQIKDFNCDQCGLVSSPGTCELCRNRVARPEIGAMKIVNHIALYATILLLAVPLLLLIWAVLGN